MKIALVQTEVKQAAFDENLESAAALVLKARNAGASLAVFPEMFVGGFNYPANSLALENGRDFVAETAVIAKTAGIHIAGSVPAISEKSHLPANRMVLVNPDGKVEMYYDKIHLFGVFKEDKYVSGGEKIRVENTEVGRIGLSICYDLRFPEMFVQLALREANLVLLSAAWPHPRMNHFRTLARARAIETQSFIVAVNQAGLEDFGTKEIRYGGESCAVDPWGETLCECAADTADMAFCEIDFSEVLKAKDRIPAMSDRKPQYYK